MEAMRESWTDDRLDDLNGKVDVLRSEMKTEFASVRGEMEKRFDRMEKRFDKGFEKIDERFERMEERFDTRLDSLNHVLILFSGGVCAALITVLAALIATQL
jgi:hypothetical protein